MKSLHSILLASTALLVATAALPPAHAETGGAVQLAQANKDDDKDKKPEAKPEAKPQPKAQPQAQPKPQPQAQPKPPAPPPQRQAQPQPRPEPKAEPKPQAAPPKPAVAPPKPAATAPQPAQPKAPARAEQKPPVPATAQKPEPKPPTPAAAPKAAPAAPAATRADDKDDKRDNRRDAREDKRDDRKDAQQDKREDKRDDRKDAQQDKREDKRDDRKDAQQDKREDKRDAQQEKREDKRDAQQDKREDRKDARDDKRDDRQDARQDTRPRNADEFIRRSGEKQGRDLDDIRRSRRETRDGDRTIIREGDRTIVRDGNRSIIRHDESDRFAVGARNIDVQRRGDQTTTVVVRPNGDRIITVTDRDGHLIKRSRRDARGRDIIIIDNSFRPRRNDRDYIVDIRRPRIRDRDHYIINAGAVAPALIYEVFMAPPVETLERRYSLDEVRYNEPLRDYMPRVDLDVNFETGSWQLLPEQIDRLAAIAAGLKRAIEKNPQEVFLIEGHTDKVGSDEDNLSLSDRRAESVAVALTEQFEVPPENLVTQGYGEQYPKVETEGSSRENRRVAVRRITPLLAQQQ